MHRSFYEDTAWILALADAPRSQVAKVLRSDARQAERLCQETKRLEHQYGDLTSPYGKVIQEFELQSHSGPAVKIEYANPQALIWVMLKNAPLFACFWRLT